MRTRRALPSDEGMPPVLGSEVDAVVGVIVAGSEDLPIALRLDLLIVVAAAHSLSVCLHTHELEVICDG